MIKPEIPINEKERLKELESYSILDTLPESDYDDLTAIAAEICESPVSLISLVDDKRQWFKSAQGLEINETPRDYAFCAHAINDPKKVFIIENAHKDERFQDNPFVTADPGVAFYAGVPLVGKNDLTLGTLCVIDYKPRKLDEKQLKSLRALANQIMNILSLRKAKLALEKASEELKEKNEELERFAMVAAHDLKSPLNGITGLINLLSEMYSDKLDAEGKNILKLLHSSSTKLSKLVEGLLEYSRSEHVLKEKKSNIPLNDFIIELSSLFTYEKNLAIDLNASIASILTNKTALEQILINLISNAIKYNDKENVEIEIGVSESDTHYEFYVQDNGAGIAPDQQKMIFEIFKIGSKSDKFGKTGNGVGLATVKKIIKNSEGEIQVSATEGEGSRFSFTIAK